MSATPSSPLQAFRPAPEWATGWVLSGTLFDGVTARPYPATLYLEETAQGVAALIVRAAAGQGLGQIQERTWRVPLGAVVIDPPLQRVARLLRFAGQGIQGVGLSAVPLGSGARFETAQRPEVTQLERWLGRNRVSRLALWLERQWGSVALSLVALMGFGYGFFQVGLPFLARQAAYLTPQRVLTSFDQQTVQYLAHSDMLAPSRLSPARQRQIRQRFAALVRERGQGYHYRLVFRKGGAMGANAFALPGGTVFITDELVALARQPIDIDAVLAHEVSHVTHRDALTQVYQALGIGLLAGAITGDLIGPSTALAAVPTALLKSQYSRQMESVADEQAGEYLLAHTGSTLSMRQMLQRLSDSEDDSEDDSQQSKKNPKNNPKGKPKDKPKEKEGQNAGNILERWLGDHPQIPQRISDLQQQEERWKKLHVSRP